jgi:subtilisin-like proprotein convertase family protein
VPTFKPATDQLTTPMRPTRRSLLGLAAGMTIAGLSGLPTLAAHPSSPGAIALAAAPARRRPKRRPKHRPKRRFRVVTRTFTNSTSIFIRDDNPALPYPSGITVSGFKGKLLDVNVRLNRFQHTYPQDVDLLLVAPNGSSAVLMSDIGSGADVDNLTLVIDDQAPAPFTNDPLRSGVYRPANRFDTLEDSFPAPASNTSNVALSTFSGINPNGTWKLYVVDDNGEDDGAILGGWSLIIKARARV